MTDSVWVYHENPDPDGCHLENCEHESREITSLVAIVTYDGISVPMHSDCAQKFSANLNLVELQKQCREHYAWN